MAKTLSRPRPPRLSRAGLAPRPSRGIQPQRVRDAAVPGDPAGVRGAQRSVPPAPLRPRLPGAPGCRGLPGQVPGADPDSKRAGHGAGAQPPRRRQAQQLERRHRCRGAQGQRRRQRRAAAASRRCAPARHITRRGVKAAAVTCTMKHNLPFPPAPWSSLSSSSPPPHTRGPLLANQPTATDNALFQAPIGRPQAACNMRKRCGRVPYVLVSSHPTLPCPSFPPA